jgi:hypothetical protein
VYYFSMKYNSVLILRSNIWNVMIQADRNSLALENELLSKTVSRNSVANHCCMLSYYVVWPIAEAPALDFARLVWRSQQLHVSAS